MDQKPRKLRTQNVDKSRGTDRRLAAEKISDSSRRNDSWKETRSCTRKFGFFKGGFFEQIPTVFFQWISADCQWITGVERKKIPGNKGDSLEFECGVASASDSLKEKWDAINMDKSRNCMPRGSKTMKPNQLLCGRGVPCKDVGLEKA